MRNVGFRVIEKKEMEKGKAVIRKLIAGDVKAFEAVYREFSRSMYLLALGLWRDPSVAQDAVQESFICLWNHRRQIDATQSVEGYLHTSVRHYILNYIRHQKIRQDREEEIIREQEFLNGPEEEDLTPRLELVRGLLATLPESCRKIFVMSVVEGMSYTDTAGKLGISVNTVKSQVKIAYRKIKNMLEENPDNMTFILLFLLSLKKMF